jgi:hypothetical protein
MSHKKGVTNNPNGRPQGSPNKATTAIREILTAFVEVNIPDLQKEYDKLEGIDKFRAIEKFMQYILPKYSTMEFLEAIKKEDKPIVIVLTEKEQSTSAKA